MLYKEVEFHLIKFLHTNKMCFNVQPAGHYQKLKPDRMIKTTDLKRKGPKEHNFMRVAS